MGQIMQAISCQEGHALVDCFIMEGNKLPLQDDFRGTCSTCRCNRSSQACSSTLNSEAQTLWIMIKPLLQALIALKFHFENLSGFTNVNLVTESSLKSSSCS